MREHKITKEEAYMKLREVVEESWMDISAERLKPPSVQQQPAPLLEAVVNATRILDFLYKDQDAYTLPHALKATLDSLYVDSIH